MKTSRTLSLPFDTDIPKAIIASPSRIGDIIFYWVGYCTDSETILTAVAARGNSVLSQKLSHVIDMMPSLTASKRPSAAFGGRIPVLHYFCGDATNPNALNETEALRVSFYKAVAVFVRAFAAIAQDLTA